MNARRAWLILVVLVCVAIFATGCHKKKAIAAVEDMNKSFGEAKDACASVYAADETSSVQKQVDSANQLKDDKKWGKALKGAEAADPDIRNLHTVSDQRRETAQAEGQAAMDAAVEVWDKAKAEGAEKYGQPYYDQAQKKIDEGRAILKDPCKWKELAPAVKEIEDLARRSTNAAIAEKQRLDEEARKAEEARRRAEEEARRRAEDDAWNKAHPPNYVVQRGDYLWRIAGMNKIYEASKFWPLIYDANRSKITDPDLIYPGQDLTIPREMDDGEMMNKLHDMWGKAALGEDL
jgi:nucleoid-associated protein YgaU